LLRCTSRHYNAVTRSVDGPIFIYDMIHERHIFQTIASDVLVRGVVAASLSLMPSSAAFIGGCAAT
jgi:hypothetical protein